MRYDFHTADNEDPPHVKVLDTKLDRTVAEIYISDEHPTKLCELIAVQIQSFLESLE